MFQLRAVPRVRGFKWDPHYIGRGRQFENTARIRELEAEIRGLRGG